MCGEKSLLFLNCRVPKLTIFGVAYFGVRWPVLYILFHVWSKSTQNAVYVIKTSIFADTKV